MELEFHHQSVEEHHERFDEIKKSHWVDTCGQREGDKK